MHEGGWWWVMHMHKAWCMKVDGWWCWVMHKAWCMKVDDDDGWCMMHDAWRWMMMYDAWWWWWCHDIFFSVFWWGHVNAESTLSLSPHSFLSISLFKTPLYCFSDVSSSSSSLYLCVYHLQKKSIPFPASAASFFYTQKDNLCILIYNRYLLLHVSLLKMGRPMELPLFIKNCLLMLLLLERERALFLSSLSYLHC